MTIVPERAANAKQPAAEAEQARRTAADAAFVASQTELLDKIGSAWKREENDRMEGWLALARLVSEFVGAELAHHGHDRATYTAATARVEGRLSACCENAKASVSRLMATHGLAVLMEHETDADDAAGIMGGLTVTGIKQLVRLVKRDTTAPGLSYNWKEPALENGPCLVRTVAEQGMTTLDLRDAVGKLMAGDDSPVPQAKSGRGRKPHPPARKAANALAKVLVSAGSARRDAVSLAARTGLLTVEDIATAAKESADARVVVVATATADEVASVARQWAKSRRLAEVKALYKALREQLGQLRAKRRRRRELAPA
jgi:hypothetical protein